MNSPRKYSHKKTADLAVAPYLQWFTSDSNLLSDFHSYMPQIEAGYNALVSLERDWDARTRDFDGDVVRRVLGTVGVKSPLFNIGKSFLKAWKIVADSSDDFELVDRMETEWNDVLNGISSVDFQLYSVSFTELVENKQSLVTNGKKALDDTVAVYGDFLKDLRSVI